MHRYIKYILIAEESEATQMKTAANTWRQVQRCFSD